MSLTGIAGASAADVGTAQTKTGNIHTVEKYIKTQSKDLKNKKNQYKTQNSVHKFVKHAKKAHKSKQFTTQNKNLKTISDKIAKKRTVKKVDLTTEKYAYGTKKYRKIHRYKKYRVHKRFRHHSKWRHKKYRVHKYFRHHSKWRHKVFYRHKKIRAHHFRYRSHSSSSIKALARSLTRGVHSNYRKGAKIFNWVRDHLSYSFYYNTRYGAAGALKYRTGNCVDTAHLVVALSRSAGLKARYVAAKARFSSGRVYGHVWAQVKANGKWYIADATSNRNSFGVARNWHSAKIRGIYNTLPF